MPEQMDRCMMHLMNDGYTQEEAAKMCNAIMNGDGHDDGKGLAVSGLETKDEEMRRKSYVAEMTTLRNGDVESYVSTEAIDRMGDIIMAAGWDLDAYRKSGSPVLFGHEQGLTAAGIPHIGNAVEMQVQRQGLWSVTRFHEKTQLSREAAMLAREKLMPAWSVGFTPKSRPEIRKSDDGEMLGFIFKDQELLEYSLVPVPANPEAVSRAVYMHRKGLISARTTAILVGPSPQAEPAHAQDDVEKALDYIRASNLAAHIRRTRS